MVLCNKLLKIGLIIPKSQKIEINIVFKIKTIGKHAYGYGLIELYQKILIGRVFIFI